MKVIFNCHVPFQLAHGGQQIQIERTMAALRQIGVETEPLQWWNADHTGDILHQVSWISPALITLAHNKGWKVAITTLLTEQCNRSRWELLLRKVLIRTALSGPLPKRLKQQLPWESYRRADQMIVGLEAERYVLEQVYGVDKGRVAVVPLGLSEAFLKAGQAQRTEEHLICTGTIGPLKNSIELARLAHAAQVPMLFVGRPFDFASQYWEQFRKLIDNRWVKHHPHAGTEQELIELLRRARGYVLMSRYENWSLAAHEAAACGLPLLVPDQRWARERFGKQARYFPRKGTEEAAAALRRFYDESPALQAPQMRFYAWIEVAEMLQRIYTKLLK